MAWLIKGITNFSSKTQYENFYDLFINLEEEIKTNSIDNLSNSKIKGKIFYFEKYDQYGGCYSLKEYFFNPKLILSKIKNFILSKLKGRRFSNNYFG